VFLLDVIALLFDLNQGDQIGQFFRLLGDCLLLEVFLNTEVAQIYVLFLPQLK
jgi:hypothetical protein